MEEPATAQAVEETAHSWSARDVEASATLGSFARTDHEGRNDGKHVGYSGRAT
jgi:hypothetical protein